MSSGEKRPRDSASPASRKRKRITGPSNGQQMGGRFQNVMFWDGKWYEMKCCQCGVARDSHGPLGKKKLLEHITKEHDRYYIEAEDKDEDDEVTLRRCKHREFSEADVKQMKRGLQPAQPAEASRQPTKKAYKKSRVGQNQPHKDLWDTSSEQEEDE